MSYEDLDIRLGNVLKCIESFKYLLAKKHYLILTSLLLEYENDSDSSIRKYASQIRSKLVANHVCIETMLNRCEEVEKAFEITSEPVDGWTFGSDISGITTYYNVADDGLISLRVEGVLYVKIKIFFTLLNLTYLVNFSFNFILIFRIFLYMNNYVLFMRLDYILNGFLFVRLQHY